MIVLLSINIKLFIINIISLVLYFIIVISFKNTLRLTNEKISKMKFNSKLRMYSPKKYRTNVKVNKFGILDIVIILVFMLFIYYIIRGVL